MSDISMKTNMDIPTRHTIPQKHLKIQQIMWPGQQRTLTPRNTWKYNKSCYQGQPSPPGTPSPRNTWKYNKSCYQGNHPYQPHRPPETPEKKQQIMLPGQQSPPGTPSCRNTWKYNRTCYQGPGTPFPRNTWNISNHVTSTTETSDRQTEMDMQKDRQTYR